MYFEAVGKAKEVKSQWDPKPLTQRYTICAAELAFLATSAGARFGDEEEEEEETDEVVDSDVEGPLATGAEEVSIEDTFEAVEEAEAAEL